MSYDVDSYWFLQLKRVEVIVFKKGMKNSVKLDKIKELLEKQFKDVKK